MYLSAVALKNHRRQLGFSQMGLVDYAASMCLPISIASIKRAELGKPVIYRTALQLARLFKEDLSKLIADTAPSMAAFSQPHHMVAHEGEFNYIRYLLAAVHNQRIGKFIYIRGVAGVGKSRMLQALSLSAAQDDFQVVQCKLHDLAWDDNIHLTLCRILGLAPTVSDAEFDAATNNNPFMVVIDDVHAANASKLELLAQLLGHTQHLPIAWLMASRHENDPLESKIRPLLRDQTVHIVDIAPPLIPI